MRLTMCERLEDIHSSLQRLVADVDRSVLPGARATELVTLLSEIERFAAAARLIAVDRVRETRAWFGSGATTMVDWMAMRTGSSKSHTAGVLETASRLTEQPAIREALMTGQISEVQGVAISAAVAADPSAETSLLDLAKSESFAALREECRDVIAAAAGDEDATIRIRRSRYFMHWIEKDGALRLDARLAPDDGAPLLAAIQARTDALVRDARRSGQHEPIAAYAADALCSLVDGAGAPRSVVHVRVSRAALQRGHTIAGETCRIDGVAPISVGAAKRLMLNGDVRLIETDGVEVGRIAHAGRTIPAHLRTALEQRDPTCVVPGCNIRRGLEIDHILPFDGGGATDLANLCRLCRMHHVAKTHHGWVISGEPGAWTWRRGSREKRRTRAP